MRKVKDTDGNDIDLDAVIQGIVAGKGNGDPAKALETLVTENYNLRRTNGELRIQVEELGKSKPEGSLVLSKDDASLFEAYKQLGKPDDLKKTITERDTLTQQVTEAKADQLISSAAEATKFRPNVLKDLVRAHTLEITMGETEVKDGENLKKVPTAFVKDKAGIQIPLDKYAETNFKDYLPSLKVETQAAQPNPPNRTPWVQQGGSTLQTDRTGTVQQAVAQSSAQRFDAEGVKKMLGGG